MQPERRGLFECTDSPREAVFIGMCTSLPWQKKKTEVTQARDHCATPAALALLNPGGSSTHNTTTERANAFRCLRVEEEVLVEPPPG